MRRKRVAIIIGVVLLITGSMYVRGNGSAAMWLGTMAWLLVVLLFASSWTPLG